MSNVPSLIRQLVMTVLWPAFLVAGVLEALLFVVVDPREFRWFGGPSLGLSVSAVYTVTFLIIWALMSASSWLTVMLLRNAPTADAGAPGGSTRIEF
ncbi:MAG: hypothetical protein ABI564_07455 [Ideonella sp.]